VGGEIVIRNSAGSAVGEHEILPTLERYINKESIHIL